jgi:hypothetical protein
MVKVLIAIAASGALVGALALAPAGHPRAADSDGPRVPVIVELFTSEGCSSCPPADEVLTTLATTQPIAGAQVIALGEHVDYWDSLGWRDPFSQARFSQRQSDYSRDVFRSDQIYTPQMVVDGRNEFVGSSMPAARRAIAEAAAETSGRAHLTIEPDAAEGHVHITIAASAGSLPDADVLLAITQDGLVTKVAAGENRGRTLQHTAVVRRLEAVGRVGAGAVSWTGDASLSLEPSWRPDALHTVVFVQDRRTRRILGAAAIPLQKRDLY